MGVGNFVCRSVDYLTVVSELWPRTHRFEIQLFDEKINFMIWQSTIQDLLVQQGLD